MLTTPPRLMPERIYEPNIIHNPTMWMGIWTPHGWRVHPKRWGRAERVTVTLSGDGKTTFFPEALRDPDTGRVAWQDDLHVKDDPLTDRGIYPCDPRVEHPIGRPRWAVSHTLLCYPVADHNLYTHEYTWDMTHGHLQTHFRRHVALEEARTDARDGRTVQVRHRPLCQTIEGNVQYPLPNSAVRGVWSDPQKRSPNLYTRRRTQLLPMLNAVYGLTPHRPVVQCHGVYPVLPGEAVHEAFDPDTGDVTDPQRLMDEFKVPLDEPKIGRLSETHRPVRTAYSRCYEREVTLLTEPTGRVDAAFVGELKERLNTTFQMGRVGYACCDGGHAEEGYKGYCATYDLNGDGRIDADDLARLETHLGREVRFNLYRNAYFGGDWVSGSILLAAEHEPAIPAIIDYDHGGGYDAQAGIVHLLETPGPNQPVWVEYHHDAPAEAGENNIRVHLYRELA